MSAAQPAQPYGMTPEDVVRCDLMTPWRHYHRALGTHEDRLGELLDGYAWHCVGFVNFDTDSPAFLDGARRYAALAEAAHTLIMASWDQR